MQPPDPPRDDSRHGQGPGAGRGESGAIPGLPGQAAFTLALDGKAPLPVLISVPHAGRTYPPDLIARMQHPLAASLRLEDRLVDLVAREVADDTGAGLIVAHAPRAMIDLNRADDDVDWDMVAGSTQRTPRGMSAGRRARSGLGLVPRRLAGLGDVWTRRLSAAELDARIDQVHRPYHAAIAAALEQLRDRWGGALLLDIHSMPPLGPKTGPDPAADFVLGDRFGASCAPALATAALAVLEASGRPAVRNRPYAGGYVLERHGAPLRGIHALQVEICRSTYLDSQMRDAGPGLASVARLLTAMVRALADALAEGRRLPQAAE